ncbi:MAG: RluA family pseudouridine synthase [Planctomycetota bacterium]|nr:MAG: RluA family pseudouridine synthase [Planctomycetota bacterium]
MPRERPRKARRGQRDLSLPYHEYRYEVGEPDHGQRLDAFLAKRIQWRSRRGVQQMIAEGMVSLEVGKDPQAAPIGSIRDGLKLRRGQEVVLRTPAPQPPPQRVADLDPESDLEVLAEDDQIVAVNKPPHISVHPSHGHLTGSLIHAIHERHRRLYPGATEVPTLCHRLDRETSGVVLCAKDQLSRTRIGRQFEARSVQKIYLALVVGEMEQQQGCIDFPLGRDLHSEVRLKMAVRPEDGQASQTDWKVEQRFAGFTLVALYPKTGRQHQLRVHLAAIGHPIVGDKLYMGDESIFIRGVNGEITEQDRRFLKLDHQALHAWQLIFEHPFTGMETTVKAPLPDDVREFCRTLSAST